jgi:hypothetical protein
MFDIGPERARHYDPRRPAMTMYYESPKVNFGADMDETLISIKWIDDPPVRPDRRVRRRPSSHGPEAMRCRSTRRMRIRCSSPTSLRWP